MRAAVRVESLVFVRVASWAAEKAELMATLTAVQMAVQKAAKRATMKVEGKAVL